MSRRPGGANRFSDDEGNRAFLKTFTKLYFENQVRYEEQARELLQNKQLHVRSGGSVIRYWIDEKGSHFKFSDDGGESFSIALSLIPLSGGEEEKIQSLRDQFANSEARLELGV